MNEMPWLPMNRTLKQWTLPLADGRWCYLFTPQPMTGAEWDHLMMYLPLYGKALVSPELSVAKALEGIAPTQDDFECPDCLTFDPQHHFNGCKVAAPRGTP